jgi:hypothetical protein
MINVRSNQGTVLAVVVIAVLVIMSWQLVVRVPYLLGAVLGLAMIPLTAIAGVVYVGSLRRAWTESRRPLEAEAPREEQVGD